MSTTNERTTEELKWDRLREQFSPVSIKVDGKLVEVNRLQDAIDDGTLDAMFVNCADTLHGGDLYTAMKYFSKLLSSKRVNLNKAPRNFNTKVDEALYAALRSYTDDKMATLRGNTRSGNSKAYWQYTLEEIEAADNIKLVESIYYGMGSKKSKYPDLIADTADFDERYAAVSAKRSAMLEAAKQQDVSVGEVLITKLNSGKKAILSAEEAATLAALLAKLQK